MSSNEPQKLFSTLIASRPPRQRRLLPWLVAAAVHIPLIAFLWFTDAGQRLRDSVTEIVTPILVIEDNPPPIAAPVEPEPPKPTREEEERERRARAQPESPAAQPPSRPGTPTGPPIGPDPLLPPGTPEPGTPVPPRSLSERLRAGVGGNPLLTAPIGPPAPLVGPEAARARLAEQLAIYNDSVAAERALAERNGNWTKTDKDGNRWGVSPGKIHLGKITIPLNNNGEDVFKASAQRREEVAQQLRTWSAIEAQAARAEIKDSFEERVKEIRKRKEAERAKKKPVT